MHLTSEETQIRKGIVSSAARIPEFEGSPICDKNLEKKIVFRYKRCIVMNTNIDDLERP